MICGYQIPAITVKIFQTADLPVNFLCAVNKEIINAGPERSNSVNKTSALSLPAFMWDKFEKSYKQDG